MIEQMVKKKQTGDKTSVKRKDHDRRINWAVRMLGGGGVLVKPS